MSLPFVESQRLISQDRNFFLFSFSRLPLVFIVGGWDLSRHNMSVKQFYRWLDTIEGDKRSFSPDIELREITLRGLGLVRYGLDTCEGPTISRNSTQLLEPGVYGPYLGNEPFDEPIGADVPPHTFAKFERDAAAVVERGHGDFNEESKMSESTMAEVRARDGNVCCITGRNDLPTRVVWLFLPALADTLYRNRDNQRGINKTYNTIDNAVTLCQALVEPFMENIFSVDIDDNKRIVTFADLTAYPNAPSLPTELPFLPAGAAPYWRANFKRTLMVHFYGGDVAFEKPEPGLNPEDLFEEVAEWGYDPKHPKWETPIGKAVLADYEEQRASLEGRS
ncbi:hypothetical protein R3P38DRAFT_2894372 [Favolaschia claudopus]|uniref:HNH nuclease domain-containing protein n=1 Tax=Favolaschia claudopus TaxID=2862362 RepID=A0AAW0CNI0_9AGAR